MPIYEYRCQDCGRTYDILHMGREIRNDVICPSCGSQNHKKLVSALAGISMKSKAADAAPCGAEGGCCSGECGMA